MHDLSLLFSLFVNIDLQVQVHVVNFKEVGLYRYVLAEGPRSTPGSGRWLICQMPVLPVNKCTY